MHKNPESIFIPPLVRKNPRESETMLEQTARIINRSRAERLRKKNPAKQIVQAPLYRPELGRR